MEDNKPAPVVFLDRDGVLCEERGYLTSVDGLHIFPYAKEVVARLHRLGYRVVVITNQSAIARGLVSEETVGAIHSRLVRETGVDAVYCCPHLPPEPGEPERPPYRMICGCRKPHTGLIDEAVRHEGLDLSDAWFVGDRAVDIETGQAAHICTVLLESGYGTARLEKPVQPDLIFDTLLDFADYLERKKNDAVSTV